MVLVTIMMIEAMEASRSITVFVAAAVAIVTYSSILIGL